MSIKLERGANVSLTKLAPKANTFFIGLGWSNSQQTSETFDIDGSCFLLDDKNHVRSNHDFIFYNQQQDSDKAVYLIEEIEQTHQGSDKTGFSIDLRKISAEISHVVFCLTIHNTEEKQQNFNMLDWVHLRLVEQETLEEIAQFRCEQELDKETAILVGEFYRYNNEWKFKAIGQGYINGLGALAENFGVLLDKVPSTTTVSTESDNELVIAKKKRKASKEIIAEQIELIKCKMKPIMPQITSSFANNINESNTRLVLDRIFQDILGYTIDEIKTEQKIQGRAADYVLSPDGQDTIVVEAKRAGTPATTKANFSGNLLCCIFRHTLGNINQSH